MKIWFAAAISPTEYGGVHQSMSGMSFALEARGHTTRIVFLKRHDRLSRLFFGIELFFRILSSPREQPDWLIARSTDGLVCALLFKRFGIQTRVALHNHGWEEKVYKIEQRLPRAIVNPRTTWRARLLRFPMLKLTLAASELCLCGTLDEMNWLTKRYPGQRAKLRLVPNGVTLPAAISWDTVDKRPPHFLTVGSLTWKKNLSYTLELFDELYQRNPLVRLFVAGTRPFDLSATCCQAVTFVGVQDHASMSRWFSRCPFIISSSRYEGGRSLALLEAMACGAIAFASAIPATTEFIHHGANGFLLTGCDIGADAALIEQVLLADPESNEIRYVASHTAKSHDFALQAQLLEQFLCGH